MKNYFNTTNEPEQLQIEFVKVNKNQDRLVYNAIKQANRPMTCYDVEDVLMKQGKGILLTSIRRSLTVLAQRINAQKPNEPKLIAVGKRLGKNGRNVIEYIAG